MGQQAWSMTHKKLMFLERERLVPSNKIRKLEIRTHEERQGVS